MANDEMLVFKDVMSLALRQMNKTFYSNKEVFLRELINNALNALDQVQFEGNTHKIISDDRLIRLVPHKANKTLSIIDFGIGLTKEDLAYNLGVGFYSAYLVAYKVIVTSKHNDHDQYIWESQPDASFIVTKDINAQQPSRGTNITLFLYDNQRFQNMEKLPWPSQFPDIIGQLYILGSSSIHGIFCLQAQYRRQHAYLWNPTINEFMVIPPSPFDYVPDYVDVVILYHGFGYDCVRNDYKVIRQLSFANVTDDDDDDQLPHDRFTAGCVWEMYSLRSNSWTNLQFGGGIPECYEVNNKFYLEGMCHWWGYQDHFIEHLVSFDLINNVWMMTPPPLDIPMDTYDKLEMYLVNRELFLLNGSIALISNYPQTTTFYVSILIEVGKKETWTKLLVFGPIPYIRFPIGIGNMSNILFQTDDGDLAWFDLSTHVLQKLGVNVQGRFSQLVVYKESLIRIEKE
ncbi:Heat shock protein [Vigna angularis]|uniref:Heat shock protein n=1 Tax=Phaseolus angularis TaxID=3914 RepID=A0A8T0K4U4_PHAAN|nr:Heat shock protein [Vigna angularis]